MADRVDLDEVAHHEPPHQGLRCSQIQLFSSLVLKELSVLFGDGGRLIMVFQNSWNKATYIYTNQILNKISLCLHF